MALKGKRQQKVQLELCSPKWKKIKVQDSNLSHVTKENAVQEMGEHQRRQCMVMLQKLMRH